MNESEREPTAEETANAHANGTERRCRSPRGGAEIAAVVRRMEEEIDREIAARTVTLR